MFDVTRDDIVGGSLSRALVVLAAPLVAQNFALVAQSVVDLFWVGRLGGTAVAAVGLATVVVALLTVPLRAFFTGSQVVTSQRVGADETEAARRVPFTAAAAAVALAAAIGGVLVVGADAVAALFTDDAAVASATASYLTAYALALVTTAASDTLESGFTGWGDTRAALYVNLTAIVVNVVLDPLLILGWGAFPRLELFGAALATAVGYGAGAALALALAARGREGFRLTRDAVRPRLETVRAVVDVGSPIAGQYGGRQVARLGMIWIVSAVGGPAALAAYHIGSQVATVAFVPAQGLAQAATSVVGQNLGAERPARARRATWVGAAIAAVGLTVFGAVQWVVPAPIAHVFVPDLSGQALSYTVLYLQILAYGYWALGVVYTVEAGFNGAGNTDVSMYSTLAQYWAVRLPVALVGAYVLDLGVAAVFWGVTLSNVAAAVWLSGYFYRSADGGMLDRAADEAAAD
ncbi:MATE family efflux transporter [Halosimplex litoreum]|uniref:Multidrug-efflux transporter n=1 Tax=Halosimplex litoreum TaxID=1198301 RepID=A0A7U3WAR6_9EURY|nr:MATE family efflux transporter [Halosimplex litoreum]QPV64711.1 MATE family efflux transporter [Halosimplex litoreum]